MEDEEMPTFEQPPDLELPKPQGAKTAPRKTPTGKVATQEYVNARMTALNNLIKTSIEPAMALMPTARRREIQAAYDELDGLINEEAI